MTLKYKSLKFRTKCPDCGNRRYLIRHHFITKSLAKYLVDVAKYEEKDIISLRNQLTVKICKYCEEKFHKEDGKNVLY